jgi:hypothetical protein
VGEISPTQIKKNFKKPLDKKRFVLYNKATKKETKELKKMIKNTYYKVMNELDEVFGCTETRKEARKIAEKTAKERKEWIWVIDVLNNNEIAVYDETGEI